MEFQTKRIKKDQGGQQSAVVSGQQKEEVSGQQIDKVSGQQKNKVGGQQIDEVGGQQNNKKELIIENYKSMVLSFCFEEKTMVEIKKLLKINSRQYISSNIIKPLINEEKLEYTNKKSVNARNQKYKTKV